MGTFFVLPVLQVVLGFDAFETGKRLFRMSISIQLADRAEPSDSGGAEDADSDRHRERDSNHHHRAGTQAMLDAGATPVEADAVTADYGNAQLDALKTSMLAVAFMAVISFWFTRRLPGKARTD